jgi:hypothetical protein
MSGSNMRLNCGSIKGKLRKESRVPLLLAILYAERTRTRTNNDIERTKEITKIKSAYLKKKYLAAQLIFL